MCTWHKYLLKTLQQNNVKTRKQTFLDQRQTDYISLTHDLDHDPDLQYSASHGHDPITCKKSMSKVSWIQMDRDRQTDGQTDRGDWITWLANAVGNYTRATEKLNLAWSMNIIYICIAIHTLSSPRLRAMTSSKTVFHLFNSSCVSNSSLPIHSITAHRWVLPLNDCNFPLERINAD